MKGRGRFIAIEGTDGAGTTTQTRLLAGWLRTRGMCVLETREPSDGPIGRIIRARLAARPKGTRDPLERTALALLFAGDRLDHVRTEIAPALARGEWVLSDRYVLSSLVYQGVDVGSEGWVAAINRWAPRADLTVLIDVPVAVAAARRQTRGEPAERYDAIAAQKRIVARYRGLARRFPKDVALIDGQADVGEVAARIADAMRRRRLVR